jgi:hypothetical protein
MAKRQHMTALASPRRACEAQVQADRRQPLVERTQSSRPKSGKVLRAVVNGVREVAVSHTDIGIAQQGREEVFEASSTASWQGIELQSVLPQRSSLAP